MRINEVRPAQEARRNRKRLGRGDASGHGGTSTKGHKGQKARSGGYHKRGFEGGQMPLQRRLPKRGFTNIFRKDIVSVNLDQLATLPSGSDVTREVLLEKRIIRRKGDGLKILGRGQLPHPLNIKAHAFSDTAKQKIEAIGGRAEVITCKP